MALGRANEKVRWINEWESIDKKTPNRLTLAVCVFALCQCGNEDDGDGDDNSTDNYVAKRSFNEVVQCINRRRRRQPHRNNNTFKGRSRHSAKLKFKIVFDSTHIHSRHTSIFDFETKSDERKWIAKHCFSFRNSIWNHSSMCTCVAAPDTSKLTETDSLLTSIDGVETRSWPLADVNNFIEFSSCQYFLWIRLKASAAESDTNNVSGWI